VKRFAIERNLLLYQAGDINETYWVRKLRLLQPDLFLVIAYGQKLSNRLLEVAKYGAINLHASLLPKYRGAAPINWAIINGETFTGPSVIRMTERMDAGDILAQKVVPIGAEETAGQLHDRLAEAGAPLVIEVIRDIALGQLEARPQDESRTTYAPRLKKSDGRICWDKGVRDLANFIRGMTPWPGAFTFIKQGRGKKPLRIVVDRAGVSDSVGPQGVKPGRVLAADAQGIRVATHQGVLAITELTPAGGRAMTAAEFLNGHRVRPGDRLSDAGA